MKKIIETIEIYSNNIDLEQINEFLFTYWNI